MRILFLPFLSLITTICFSQQTTDTTTFSPPSEITRYPTLNDTSAFSMIREIWKTNQGFSYITFPIVQSIGDRRIDLQQKEGKQGYKFEANLNFRLPLFKPNENTCGFMRISRFTLDYHSNFRMTADSSSPLTPPTQEVGLGYDINIWNNKQRAFSRLFKDDTFKESSAVGAIKSFSLTLQAHHYSNGQPPGFFIYTSDSSEVRNDYSRGDFSTNFIKVSGLYNILTPKNNLWSFTTWGRFDGRFYGFEFTPDQQYRFGQNRVGLSIDFLSKPQMRNKTKTWIQDGKQLSIKKAFVFQARLSIETIIGKLHLFDANLTSTNNTYRTNINLDLRYLPLNSSSLSLFTKFYIGRDYLNIRYDDIIWTSQIGISVPLNSYRIPRWDSKESFVN